jgi:hypothetical protein
MFLQVEKVPGMTQSQSKRIIIMSQDHDSTQSRSSHDALSPKQKKYGDLPSVPSFPRDRRQTPDPFHGVPLAAWDTRVPRG